MVSSAVLGRFAEPGRLPPSLGGVLALVASKTLGWICGGGFCPLRNGDFVAQLLHDRFQLLDAVLLHANNGEQALDQRSALIDWDIGKLPLHTVECRKTSPDQLRPN